MIDRIHKSLSVLIAGAVVLGVVGCSSTQPTGHEVSKKAAEKRWMAVRSHMMLKMAQQQFDTGDLDQAQSSIQQAMAIDRDNPRLYVLNGRIELERGRLERSHKWLTIATRLDPNLADGHYYQGVVLQRWQEWDKALDAYRKAMGLAPDNPAYLLAFAEIMIQKDQIDLAMELLKDKQAYFDQNAGIRVALGQLHMLRGESAEAVKYFRRAALLRPDEVAIQEDLARAFIQNKQHGEAVRILEKLARDPETAKRADIQRLLGETYLKTDRPHEARDLFVKLTRQDKSDAQAWLRLGEASVALQDDLGALTAARHAIKNDPGLAEAYMLAGLVFQKRQQLAEAAEMFDLAAENAPKDARPRVLQGIMYQRAGQKDAARDAYTDALRREPSDTRVQRLLAGVTQ